MRTTTTIDPALKALLEQHKAPSFAELLDRGARAWLREQGVEVPDRVPPTPGHEHARLAAIERRAEAAKKKSRGKKKGP